MNQGIISFHPTTQKTETVFSVLIPSWNNVRYLQCCINSIRKNSLLQHEIVVHVNEGSDGTIEWLKEQNISYSYSKENTGVCFAFNAASALATNDLIVLTDDDKYFCPGWDKPLYDEYKKLDHIYFAINATSIEWKTTTNKCVMAPHHFGDSIETFNEQKLLAEYDKIPFEDWTGGNWYPMLLHKNVWTIIGGLSIEFSPGMGSDPDMMMKLWKAGVRYYKGISSSRVYHFISKSVSRMKKNDGYTQFLQKWGMANSTFFRHYLKLGEKFSGYSQIPDVAGEVKNRLLKDKLKRIISFIKK